MRFLKIGVSALLFFAVAWLVYSTGNLSAIKDLSVISIAAAAAALMASNLLAIVRLRLVSSAVGYRLSWGTAAAALSVGTLGGALFFQIAGQLIGRNFILSKKSVPPGAVIIVTGIERGLALSISFTLALVGAWLVYGRALSINYQDGGAAFIRILAGAVAVFSVVCLVCWRGQIAAFFKSLSRKFIAAFVVAFALSFAIQIATMAAYVAMALPYIAADGALMFGAVALIMFAASIPISFAGWGVRELSAIAAFGAIGMASQPAFIVASAIGVLSILIMIVIAAISSRMNAAATVHSSSHVTQIPIVLNQALAPVAGVLVLFSVYLPVSSGYVNITLADPVAIIGGALFVLHYASRRSLPTWGDNRVTAAIIAITAAIVLSYLIGLYRFGPTVWAGTKLSGWFVLLAYFATGSLTASHYSRSDIPKLAWPYAVACAAIVIFEFIFSRISLPTTADFTGFLNNRNAYALAMICALIVSLSNKRHGLTLIGAIALSGVFLSGSKTGIICAPIVMLAALGLRFISITRFSIISVGASLLYVVLSIATVDLTAISSISVWRSANEIFRPGGPLAGASAQQHLSTVLDGLRMFLDYPIFGAGLGAYLQNQGPDFIIIHSSPVWILAEMGLFGIYAFVFAGGIAADYFFRMRSTPIGRMGILLLLAVSLFGQLHEIIYQREIWLLLGLLLARPMQQSTLSDKADKPTSASA